MVKYDWNGWDLANNVHGEQFDLEARKRMINGSRKLFPFIEKYKEKLGSSILEVGPFFNPLITINDFPLKNITYWDNDKSVIEYLNKRNFCNNISFCDLNSFESISKQNGKFNCVIASHVFNYIDYKQFLTEIKKFMKDEALLFVNTSANYDLPLFFSAKRPKSNNELLETLQFLGFKILEKKEIETTNKKYQPNNRFIIIAQKEY